MCGARLQQEDFGENNLVVKLLELLQEILRHAQSLAVVLGVDVAGQVSSGPL